MIITIAPKTIVQKFTLLLISNTKQEVLLSMGWMDTGSKKTHAFVRGFTLFLIGTKQSLKA